MRIKGDDAYKVLSSAAPNKGPKRPAARNTITYSYKYYYYLPLWLFLILTLPPSERNCTAARAPFSSLTFNKHLSLQWFAKHLAISSLPNSWNSVCLNLNCLKLSVQQIFFCVFFPPSGVQRLGNSSFSLIFSRSCTNSLKGQWLSLRLRFQLAV